MVTNPAYILVWGATPNDDLPLFPVKEALAKDHTVPVGPPAGAFRVQVLRELNSAFRSHPYPVTAIFSEDWEIHGHAPENAGFYEPIQLEEAALVVILLPGPRSLAVNTWEMTLALESAGEGEPVIHLDKLILLLPETVYHYIREVLVAGVTDPKDFKMFERTGKPEPLLGAANSFVARWLCLAIRQRYGMVDPWSKMTSLMGIAFYKDKESWGLGSAECEATLGKLLSLAERRFAVLKWQT